MLICAHKRQAIRKLLEDQTNLQLKTPATGREEDSVFTSSNTPYSRVTESILPSIFPGGLLSFAGTHLYPPESYHEGEHDPERLGHLWTLHTAIKFDMAGYGCKEPIFTFLNRAMAMKGSLDQDSFVDLDIGVNCTPDPTPTDDSLHLLSDFFMAVDLSDTDTFFFESRQQGLQVHVHPQFFVDETGRGDIGGIQITFPKHNRHHASESAVDESGEAPQHSLVEFAGLGVRCLTMYSMMKKYLFSAGLSAPQPRNMGDIHKHIERFKNFISEIDAGEHAIPRSAAGVRIEFSLSIPAAEFRSILDDPHLLSLWVARISRLFNISHLRQIFAQAPAAAEHSTAGILESGNTLTTTVFTVDAWLGRLKYYMQCASLAHAFSGHTKTSKITNLAKKWYGVIALSFGFTNWWLNDYAATTAPHHAVGRQPRQFATESDEDEHHVETHELPSMGNEPLTAGERHMLMSAGLTLDQQQVFRHTLFHSVQSPIVGAPDNLTFTRKDGRKSKFFPLSVQGKVDACEYIMTMFFKGAKNGIDESRLSVFVRTH